MQHVWWAVVRIYDMSHELICIEILVVIKFIPDSLYTWVTNMKYISLDCFSIPVNITITSGNGTYIYLKLLFPLHAHLCQGNWETVYTWQKIALLTWPEDTNYLTLPSLIFFNHYYTKNVHFWRISCSPPETPHSHKSPCLLARRGKSMGTNYQEWGKFLQLHQSLNSR